MALSTGLIVEHILKNKSKMPFAPFQTKTIKALLQQNNLKPLKRMGQNFLISKSVLEKIIAAAELKPEDIVLEIGPGLGALTIALAQKVSEVIAIEKDKKLAQILSDILKRNRLDNVKITNADALSTNYKLPTASYKLISNLPYNIATAVIMKFLEAKNPPESMVIMVQKEVGQRICSEPPKMQKLAVFCQVRGKPEIVGYVSKKNFYPQPKVDSVILKITPSCGNPVAATAQFAEIVKAGFSHPRKQLLNNFSLGLRLSREKVESWLLKNNIQPTQRAQTLTIQDWLNLTKSV